MKRLILILLALFMTPMLISCAEESAEESDVTVTKSERTYLEDSEDRFTVYTFDTDVEGPTFFIIGGIHGDERAGWMAAQEMLTHDFRRGTVHILPIANRLATVQDPPRRNAPGRADLNRAFPGDADGSALDRLAHALFAVIAQKEPDIVLDLHESLESYTEGRVGDSIVLHDSSHSLYGLSVIETFNALPLMEGRTPFTNLNAPPQGSINRTFTETYGVPVFTIETNRDTATFRIDDEGVPLSVRIEQQVELIKIFLDTFMFEE
ncbi:MAG: succinylglutamate desuccinylase/aspartoacylase family protein [Acholeplasmataceae bacterium]